MRKLLLIAFITLFGLSVNAQQKLGYLNSLELLSLMPEIKPADAQLEKYAKDLDAAYTKMLTEYQNKVTKFQKEAEQGLITDINKEIKIKEIQDMEKRITDFEDKIEEKMMTKRETLYEPILEKADVAIKAVAKEKGYAYIFDTSSGALLFANDADNVLSFVKAKLGIK
jgi:outer membrane protein